MIPIPTRATTTRGWARWGGGGQDLGTAYVVVAEASCPVICHSRPPDQDLITALPMEVTAVVTAVSSDSVLWSL